MPGNSGGKAPKGGSSKAAEAPRGKDPKAGGSGTWQASKEDEDSDDDGFTTVTRRGKGKGEGRSGGASKSKSAGGPSGTAGAQSRGGPSGTRDGAKGEGHSGAPKAPRREGGPRGTSSAGSKLSELRKLWRKRGACLSCGSSAHRIKDCSLTPSSPSSTTSSSTTKAPPAGTPKTAKAADPVDPRAYRDYDKEKKSSYADTAAKGSSKSKAEQDSKPSGSGKSRGAKRSRDPAPTGQTPPAKTAKNFSYAKATAGAIELVILNEDEGHIEVKQHDRLKMLVEELWIQQLEKDQDLVAIDKWSYTYKMATVHVADSASAAMVATEAKKLKLVLKSRAQVEAERRPTVILTGLITGPAAKRERQEIERFLKAEVNRMAIPGRLQFYQGVPTKAGNLLLRIIVDDFAEERLKQLDYQLRVGASGLVKFEDERASKKVDQRSRAIKLERLQAEIEQGREQLKAKCKALRELQRCDTESVGSMGLGNLQMETETGSSTEAPAERLATVDEDTEDREGGTQQGSEMQE